MGIESSDFRRLLEGSDSVRLQWYAEQSPRATIRHWHLLILTADSSRGVSIDTGLTSGIHERDPTRAQGPVVKAVACVLMGWGWKVILPTGHALEREWFEQSVRGWPWSEPRMG